MGKKLKYRHLDRPGENAESLPALSDEALGWLEEKLTTLIQPAKQVIEEYASRKEGENFP